MKRSDETTKNRQTEENDERNLQTKSKFMFSVIDSRESVNSGMGCQPDFDQ